VGKVQDLFIHRVFDRLTVIERAPNKSGHIYYTCECKCGNIVTVRKQNLTEGITHSCGCFRIEKTVSRSISYNTFVSMGDMTKMIDNFGNECFIDSKNRDRVSSQYWSMNPNTYWESQRYKKRTKLHRFIMNCTDIDKVVDHIDGNPSMNIESNLRVCSPHENSCNHKVQCNNKLGFTGITLMIKTGKYRVRIKVNKEYIYLGYFNSLEKAARERKKAEIKYFGKFRRVS